MIKAKPIRCIETGIEYPSIHHAAKELGLHKQNISAHIAGKTGFKTVGGFTFERVT